MVEHSRANEGLVIRVPDEPTDAAVNERCPGSLSIVNTRRELIHSRALSFPILYASLLSANQFGVGHFSSLFEPEA